MKQHRFSQWAVFWVILFFGTAYAASNNEIPRRVLKIVSGDHQLPIVLQSTVLKRILLSFGDTHGSAVKLLAPDRQVKPNEVSESRSGQDLLDMDRIWMIYREASGTSNSIFSGNIQALDSPLSVRQSGLLTDTPLDISSDGGNIIWQKKILPQNVDYLIRRQLGIHKELSWHMIEEGNSIILKHPLRIDMDKISSIELDINSAVYKVNFQYSRKASGRRANKLLWEDIPKDIVEHKTRQRIRFDFTSIRQNILGNKEDSLPLYLIEIIIFIDKTKFTDGQINLNIPQLIAYFDDASLVRISSEVILTPKFDTKNSILTLPDVPLSTDVAANLYLRWLTIILFVAFFLWALILWQLRTTQRNFFVGNRYGIYLLLLQAALVYAFLVKLSILNPSIEGGEIGLLIFSAFAALHAWRWRVQLSLVNQLDVKVGWIVDQGKWPPLAVWALTGAILLIMVVVQWQVHFTATEEQAFMTNLAASDMSSVLEMLILRVLLIMNEQVLNMPVMLAFGYGFLPWIWAWALGHMKNWKIFFASKVEKVASLCFRVALAMLVVTGVMLSVNFKPIAEQLAIIAYFCLVTGMVLEAWSMRKGDKMAVDIPNRE
jgi:hypothetical protein